MSFAIKVDGKIFVTEASRTKALALASDLADYFRGKLANSNYVLSFQEITVEEIGEVQHWLLDRSEIDAPAVTCICPTYGRCPSRQWLLEEAVESFLRQDYQNKELIVLNDCPVQELVCDAPGVRVVNSPLRLPSLGEKYNALAALASGELICPWEDDDLSLPHRLSQAVEHLGDSHYWNPQQLYYWEFGKLPVRDHGGVCHNASVYRKAAWWSAGRYEHVNGAQDARFDAALHRLGIPAPPLRPDERPAYIYRWGVSDMHLSGNADHERAYREYGKRCVQQGTFVLRPHWRQDYEKLCPV